MARKTFRQFFSALIIGFAVPPEDALQCRRCPQCTVVKSVQNRVSCLKGILVIVVVPKIFRPVNQYPFAGFLADACQQSPLILKACKVVEEPGEYGINCFFNSVTVSAHLIVVEQQQRKLKRVLGNFLHKAARCHCHQSGMHTGGMDISADCLIGQARVCRKPHMAPGCDERVAQVLSFFTGRAVDKYFLRSHDNTLLADCPDLFQQFIFRAERHSLRLKRIMTHSHPDFRCLRRIQNLEIAEGAVIIKLNQIRIAGEDACFLIAAVGAHFIANPSVRLQFFPMADDYFVSFFSLQTDVSSSDDGLTEIVEIPSFFSFLSSGRLPETDLKGRCRLGDEHMVLSACQRCCPR
ncbi:MAG: hypothetical protein BWY07_01864 [Candidatus Hydrogenedentes bacterium ADurb.Bin170]|nr:MAG: hypothetical protein BWY07_01864 [Candidatus Hydrogenedentes bacterium ADurb.Bin170]